MFIAFFKMGLFTIGGGLAMIPLMQKYAVEDKKWLTEEEMVDCVAISYSIPGVVAINAATFIGKKRYGMIGAIVATLGVILPSLFCIIAIVLFLGQIENNKYVQGAFVGLMAAACGLIAVAMVKLGKQAIKDKAGWVIAIASGIAITIFDINAILVIVAAGLAGFIFMRKPKDTALDGAPADDEADGKDGKDGDDR